MRNRFDVCMRHFESDEFAKLRDTEWFGRQVAVMPWRWQEWIRRKWLSKWSPEEAARQPANLFVLETVSMLTDSVRAGLRPDAGDLDVKTRADVMARHFREGVDRRGEVTEEARLWALGSMERSGLVEFWPGKREPVTCRELAPMLARLKCVRFWRRVLRGVLAKSTEACSVLMGMVSNRDQCYASEMCVRRYRAQQASGRKVIEQTYLENEFGQQVAIAELADKGTGNRGLRLAEMMTRISGMDLIAQDMGHAGIFITVTCPSRMHSMLSVSGQANPKYDRTTPKEAQNYLANQWEKLGPWLDRRGVERYGFRVVEPHHDGCPHWHILLFYAPRTRTGANARAVLQHGFNLYFLSNDSPNEPGAKQRRITYKRIDRSKGSAAAYIAKYISKNTTGLAMDVDLYGNPIVTAVERVQAWASASGWRIRQFQQIKGVPVGVWRELRRINPQALEGAPLPKSLTDALRGVNIGQMGGRVAVGYQAYTMAQGGPCVNRKHQSIKLLRQDSGELNRYGEVRAADVIGVTATGWNMYRPAHMQAMLGPLGLAPELKRPARANIETERCQWRGVSRAQVRPEEDRKARAEGSRPWTRVNNSTLTHWTDGKTGRDVALVSRSKTGNFRGWGRQVDGNPPDQGIGNVEN